MLELSSGDQDLPAKSIERCLLIGGNHDDELDFEVNVLREYEIASWRSWKRDRKD